MNRRRADAGFSLIELVAALAVFAVVALLSLQALQGSLLSDRALRRIDADNAALGLFLARLRLDLDSAAALAFTLPAGEEQPPAIAGADGFALTVAGQGGFAHEPAAGFARAEWRLDGATLTRRLWPSLKPARDQVAGPEIAVLKGVTALSVESFAPGAGWRAGIPQTTVEPGADPALPAALRITLDTVKWGRIELVEALP